MNRLASKYQTDIRPELYKNLNKANVNQSPRLVKIVVSSGVGRAAQDDKHLEPVVATLTKITGQKPVLTRAKHSIATFKLREGNQIGAKVTMRGERMWYFLDRLISIVLPRLRDFRGLPASGFDGHGNYSIGLAEQVVFPEIGYEEIAQTHGLQITIVTSADNDSDAKALLTSLGLPLERTSRG